MKVLILTGRFGMGHYCAAQAVKEEIIANNKNCEVKIVDILEYTFPILNKLVYSVFNKVICKFPSVYSFMNTVVAKHEDSVIEKRALAKFDLLVRNYNPDMIISTWSTSGKYASDYISAYRKNIPLYTYITDITVHDGWICDNTKLYFVGGTVTKNALIYRGVAPEKIIVTGIPVRQAFKKEHKSKTQADKKEVLIMGGGLGLIPSISSILKVLSENNSIHITVITGKNKRLSKKLKKNFPLINVVGYTENVSEYMQNSDLLISKPGGITLFEAIYSSTPLYIIKPFFSQEIGNAQFIEKACIGKIAWEDNFDISKDIITLLQNTELIAQMKNNMDNFKKSIVEAPIQKGIV